MASINFLPVCSKCKSIIWEVIDYKSTCESGLLVEKQYSMALEITPEKCPVCGERFESINVPTRFPYDNLYHDQEVV